MIIELKDEKNTLISINIWDLILLHIMQSGYAPDLEKTKLYFDGKEVPKPSEWYNDS